MPLGAPDRRGLPWGALFKVFGSVLGLWVVLGTCAGWQARQAREAGRREERARAEVEAKRSTHRFCVAEEGKKTESYDDLPPIAVGARCFGARGLLSPAKIELSWNSNLFGTSSTWYVHEGTLSLRSRQIGGRDYTGVYQWGGNGDHASGRITWFNCYGEKCIGILESDPHRKVWFAYPWERREDPGRYWRISLAPIE